MVQMRIFRKRGWKRNRREFLPLPQEIWVLRLERPRKASLLDLETCDEGLSLFQRLGDLTEPPFFVGSSLEMRKFV